MTKNNIPHHWQEDHDPHLIEPRRFVDVSYRMELPGLPAPLLLSNRLNALLFPETLETEELDIIAEPEVPCREVAARFSEAAIVLATAIAVTDRTNPVCVEIPVIEGRTQEKTYVKVFSFREDGSRDGFMILLQDEEDPTALEFAELEADAFCFDDFDDWFDF